MPSKELQSLLWRLICIWAGCWLPACWLDTGRDPGPDPGLDPGPDPGPGPGPGLGQIHSAIPAKLLYPGRLPGYTQ